MNVLIKYECGNSTKENANSQLKREYDGIGHRLTTATAATTNQTKPKSGGIRQKEVEKLPKRSTAVVTEQKEKIDKDKQMKTTKTEQPPLTSPNDEKFPNRRQNVRGKTKPIGRIGIRNTPVDLYQKYKSDWEKFKRFIPGENSRDEVRREVRAKIQKQPPPKPLVVNLK